VFGKDLSCEDPRENGFQFRKFLSDDVVLLREWLLFDLHLGEQTVEQVLQI